MLILRTTLQPTEKLYNMHGESTRPATIIMLQYCIDVYSNYNHDIYISTAFSDIRISQILLLLLHIIAQDIK